MIKTIKIISLVLCGLMIYAFIGGVTFGAFSARYPGGRCHAEDERPAWPEAHCHSINKDALDMAVFWPASVPIWGLMEGATRIGRFGNDIFKEATQ
jgi:hypothetical protein